jgi:HK97 family phage prohead protease
MIELRDISPRYRAISGLATTYNRDGYFVAGRTASETFREVVRPGAFENASNPKSKIELRVEHDQAGPVLASTREATLEFKETAAGLMTGGALSKTDPNAISAVERYRRGELRAFSVGMVVLEDHWPKPNERHIHLAHLKETSMVTRPANPGAIVMNLRAETRSVGTGLIEYRYVPIAFRGDEDDVKRVPPHLRLAGFGRDQCSTCAAYDPDRAACAMYGYYPVAENQVCDSWTTTWTDDDDDEQTSPVRSAASAKAGDRATTFPHLAHSLLSDLRHSRRHVDRMKDPEVQSSKKSMDHNAEHASRHLASAEDQATRLIAHSREHASDPEVFGREFDALTTKATVGEMTDDLASERVALESSMMRAAIEEVRRDYSRKQREEMARQGLALPDGSFPIRDKVDLVNAIRLAGKATDPAKARAHIKKRVRALGLSALIPDSWT